MREHLEKIFEEMVDGVEIHIWNHIIVDIPEIELTYYIPQEELSKLGIYCESDLPLKRYFKELSEEKSGWDWDACDVAEELVRGVPEWDLSKRKIINLLKRSGNPYWTDMVDYLFHLIQTGRMEEALRLEPRLQMVYDEGYEHIKSEVLRVLTNTDD